VAFPPAYAYLTTIEDCTTNIENRVFHKSYPFVILLVCPKCYSRSYTYVPYERRVRNVRLVYSVGIAVGNQLRICTYHYVGKYLRTARAYIVHLYVLVYHERSSSTHSFRLHVLRTG